MTNILYQVNFQLYFAIRLRVISPSCINSVLDMLLRQTVFSAHHVILLRVIHLKKMRVLSRGSRGFRVNISVMNVMRAMEAQVLAP